MKHLFLDTNVLIDFLIDRKPFSLEAAKLFNYSLKKKVNLYVAAVSYNNIYYILNRNNSNTQTINSLSELFELTEIIDVSKEIIKKSLHSDFKDFEDAIQYHTAKSFNKIDCIVTRNTKDFKTSVLPVFNVTEALSFLESTI
jgi:predicted nucleic acid-binding protein